MSAPIEAGRESQTEFCGRYAYRPVDMFDRVGKVNLVENDSEQERALE